MRHDSKWCVRFANLFSIPMSRRHEKAIATLYSYMGAGGSDLSNDSMLNGMDKWFDVQVACMPTNAVKFRN